ncbi:MAG: hypothetical protein ACLPVI_07380 [Dehalococcoidales bacterium]
MENAARRIKFRITWMVMSEKSRYAYLWGRTEQHLRQKGSS